MKQYLIILLLLVGNILFAQKATLKGIVTDYKTRETLVGVNIILNETQGVTTDIDGKYEIQLEPGRYSIDYKFIGYTSRKRIERFEADQVYEINMRLESESKILEEVVVSAGKFEQKVSEVTVSMEIIKASMIENTNTQRIETALQQVPSIMMMDGQASIRGGSGYSFGAGSRVLLLVDDLPLLAGSSGIAYWDFAPVENIDQIEIMKGASSALYGSSALNGVINVRTKYPKMEPETKLIMSTGIYDNPVRPEVIWRKGNLPVFSGAQFLHSQMFGNFDLVLGGNFYSDDSYREADSRQHGRINVNTRWRHKKIKGLAYGVNMNYMKWHGGRFLLWENGDSGIYKVAESYKDYRVNNTRLNIDPYITYFSSVGNRHSLRTRFFRTLNRNTNNLRNDDDLYYVEYQYQKYLENNLTWSSGVVYNYMESSSEIYGDENHFGSSIAAYSQIDKKVKKFTGSLGARWEAYRLDEDETEGRPVFRSGLNYELKEHTNLRASFGQGYRYPTVSEKFIHASAGPLNIFPNDTLKPERGWSTELAVRQGFKISNWVGFIDLAGFWSEYYDMIEFGFGYHFPYEAAFYPPDTVFKYLGFKSYNISNAQITGIDLTVGGHGSVYGIPIALMAGYTYTNPVDLDIKQEDKNKNTSSSNILKYRYYHSAKGDIEATIKKVNIGFSINYFSAIVNIDKVFEDSLRFPNGTPIIQYGEPMFILPGLREYREKNNKGQVVFDIRLGVDVNKFSRISIVAKNIFNKEYMIRPADVQAPRSFALQYILRV